MKGLLSYEVWQSLICIYLNYSLLGELLPVTHEGRMMAAKTPYKGNNCYTDGVENLSLQTHVVQIWNEQKSYSSKEIPQNYCQDVQYERLQRHIKFNPDQLKSVQENEANRFCLLLTLWPWATSRALKVV